IFLARSDGIVLFGIFSAAVLVDARRDGRALRKPLAALGACVGVYVLWSAGSFGTPTPPGPQAVPFLPSFDVYDFGVAVHPSWRSVGHWLGWGYMRERLGLAASGLRMAAFTPPGDA